MLTATKDDNISTLKPTAPSLHTSAADAGQEAKRDLNAAANEAGRKGRGFLHMASDELTHARDTVTTHVRSNPVQSSLVALGVGFVLGTLLRR